MLLCGVDPTSLLNERSRFRVHVVQNALHRARELREEEAKHFARWVAHYVNGGNDG
jgi:hypothetical protein